MRTHLTIFLLLTFFALDAQTTDNASKTACDNYYSPFHLTIKDSTKKTVSTFGHYFSVSYGWIPNKTSGVGSAMLGYSLAYKSHLISVTYGTSNRWNTYSYLQPYPYTSNYFGLLIGESLRLKHFVFTFSTGVGYTKTSVFDWVIDHKDTLTGYNVIRTLEYKRESISIPIECKVFFLARNGLGFGLHIAKNIISPSNCSPFYFGLSIVGGRWNVSRRKK